MKPEYDALITASDSLKKALATAQLESSPAPQVGGGDGRRFCLGGRGGGIIVVTHDRRLSNLIPSHRYNAGTVGRGGEGISSTSFVMVATAVAVLLVGGCGGGVDRGIGVVVVVVVVVAVAVAIVVTVVTVVTLTSRRNLNRYFLSAPFSLPFFL